MIFQKIKAKFGGANLEYAQPAHRRAGVLASTKYLGADGEVAGVLRAFPTELEIVSDVANSVVIEWSDFSRASWDSSLCELSLQFVDPQLPTLVLPLPEDYDDGFVLVVRERIDRSVVFQLFDTLPSGVRVYGLVRRNVDESLFTQIITDAEPTSEDQAAMCRFESELRQNVGL